MRRAEYIGYVCMGVAVALLSTRAHADGPSDTRAAITPAPEPPTLRLAFQSAIGDGLRFQNPFRLSHVLGADASSVSSTAAYGDLALTATWGEVWRSGGSLRWDFALAGVGQSVVTPSYVLMRRFAAFEAHARIGLPIIVSPDPNVGGEVGVGGAWFPLAGVGLRAELIGTLFEGAAAPDDRHPIYPLLSGELGIVIEWERLP